MNGGKGNCTRAAAVAAAAVEGPEGSGGEAIEAAERGGGRKGRQPEREVVFLREKGEGPALRADFFSLFCLRERSPKAVARAGERGRGAAVARDRAASRRRPTTRFEIGRLEDEEARKEGKKKNEKGAAIPKVRRGF